MTIFADAEDKFRLFDELDSVERGLTDEEDGRDVTSVSRQKRKGSASAGSHVDVNRKSPQEQPAAGNGQAIGSTRNVAIMAKTSLNVTETSPIVIPDTLKPSQQDCAEEAPAQSTGTRRQRQAKADAPASSRPNKRRKKSENVASVPEAQQFFKGLRFFFVPNDFRNKARAKQRELVLKFGGSCPSEWDSNITHVIVDHHYTYQHVLQIIGVDYIDDAIKVINDKFLPECIARKKLLDCSLVNFQVKGRAVAEASNPPQAGNTNGAATERVQEPEPKKDVFNAQTFPARPTAAARTLSSTEITGNATGLRLLPQLSHRQPSNVNISSLVIKSKTVKTSRETQRTEESSVSKQSSGSSKVLGDAPSLENAPKQDTDSHIDDVGDCPASKSENGKENLEEMIAEAKKGHAEFLEELDESESGSCSGSDSEGSDGEVVAIKRSKKLHGLTRGQKVDKAGIEKAFQCYYKHTGEEDSAGPNAKVIQILSEMHSHYERMRDQWRSMAYKRAISTLRRQTVPIVYAKDAVKLPFIGARLALKIEEIALTNRLRQLQYALSDPDNKLLKLFTGVYGAGFVQAQQWIAAGYTSLEDLLAKATLTDNQRIGVERYTDFAQRIPREEVRQHGELVIAAAKKLDPNMQAEIMGSYRRGAPTCGDIDLILTKPGAEALELAAFLDDLAAALTRSGFLKATLASAPWRRGDGAKLHGASQLAAGLPWRRIDLLMVPWRERGAALVYFTGNDVFNRSLRLLAARKGYRLNQRGLYRDVLRGGGRGGRGTEGRLVEGESERRIFEVLGVPWRPPGERNC